MSKKNYLILFASLILIMGLTVCATALFLSQEEETLEDGKQKLLTTFDQLELQALQREGILRDSLGKDSGIVSRMNLELDKIVDLVQKSRGKLVDMGEDLNNGMLDLLRKNAETYQSRLEQASSVIYNAIDSRDPAIAAVNTGTEEGTAAELRRRGWTAKSVDVERILFENQRLIETKEQEITLYSRTIGDKEMELNHLKTEVNELKMQLSENRVYRSVDYKRSFRMSGWTNTGGRDFASYELGPKGIGPRGLEYVKVEFLLPKDHLLGKPLNILIFDDSGHQRKEYNNTVKERWVYCEIPLDQELKPGRHFIQVKIGDRTYFNRKFMIKIPARS